MKPPTRMHDLYLHAPQTGGTDLTLRHEGFAAPERRDSHNNGWTGTLDKLAAYLRSPPSGLRT